MASILGTPADDVLTGTNLRDLIDGQEGDDWLAGEDDDDTLNGDEGSDTLIGGSGMDILDGSSNGGADDDAVDTVTYLDPSESGGLGVSVDLAAGTATDTFGDTDTLYGIELVGGSAQDDQLTGGNPGFDRFEGFLGYQGDDTINGASGYDEVRYDEDAANGGTSGIVAILPMGTIIDGFGDADVVAGIEGIRGTQYNDVFVGDGADNTFAGLAGSDLFVGEGGTDVVDYSLDRKYGGTSGINVDLAANSGSDGFGDRDFFSDSIDMIYGTSYADTIAGGAGDVSLYGFRGDDSLTGGDGDDKLFGQAGDDTVLGRNGDDTLVGRGGDDRISGGNGADVLLGGDGQDVLVGGAGDDTFYYRAVYDEADFIRDFDSENDILSFYDDAFKIDAGTTLQRGFNYIESPSGAPRAETPTFIFDRANGRLHFDIDGTGDDPAQLIALMPSALGGGFGPENIVFVN